MKEVSELVSPRQRRTSGLVAYKATADVVSKAVTLLVTVGAARVLAPESFGVLALAMTTGWILGVASDAGLPLYLARAVATAGGSSGAVLGRVMRLRMQLALGALTAGVFLAFELSPRDEITAFTLIVIAQLAGAVLEALSHVYRGLGRSEIESTITIAQRLAAAVLAILVLLLHPTLLTLGAALVAPPVCALVASFVIARRLAGAEGDELSAPAPTTATLLRDAGPIGLGVMVSALYFRCDVYFISHWHGLDAVGMYNAVFRLVEALRLFPAAVLAVVFPDLCRAGTTQPLRRLAVVLTCAGLLAMAFTMAAAPGIVHVTYGPAYAAAAGPLQVLALALPLFFLNYALTHQVIAWNGQRRYLALTGAALVANVAANALLIPSGGMLGAAWATLLTEVVVTAGCLVALGQRREVSRTTQAASPQPPAPSLTPQAARATGLEAETP